MFYSGIAYLRELASRNPTSLDDARLQAYAIYVLTRNEIITTNYLTNLQRYLDSDKDNLWQKDITSAYLAAVYRMMQNTAEAERLIGLYSFQPGSRSDFYDEGTANAQYLYLLARHFPELARQRESLVMPLVKALNSGEINTVFASYATLALSAYSGISSSIADSSLTISGVTADGGQRLLSTASNGFAKANLEPGVTKAVLSNPGKQTYFYQLTQAGFDTQVSTETISNGIEIYREYRSLDSKDVISSTSLGSEIEVRIRVRALGDTWLSNVAIVDLLPGGFEVVDDTVDREHVEYSDVREDRVLFFTGLDATVKELVYHIKATNQGDFTVPGIFAQSMYDPSVISRGAAGKITVTADQ